MKIRVLLAALAALPSVAGAQSYDDLTLVRARPSPFASVLQLRAGVLGGLAGTEDVAIGLEDKTAWDGHIYYRQERLGNRDALLEGYAGRDGAYIGLNEGKLTPGQTQSRIELTTRYFPFYREGYYRGDEFVPTGRYEGTDYGVSVGFARLVDEGLRLEVGPFFRSRSFSENETTAANYEIPDDFIEYGARAVLEHNTLVLDRTTGRPRQGYILALAGEAAQNDSSKTFGLTGTFETTLPRRMWRAQGHLEWYFPWAQSMTWVLEADGSLTDAEDRVNNYDAQSPPGHAWVDGELKLRFELGSALVLTPFGKGQFIRILGENGVSNEKETFWGGGLDASFDVGDSFSIVASYSYLTNESRAPVSTSVDTFGEHRFFAGMEVRFGGQRN